MCLVQLEGPNPPHLQQHYHHPHCQLKRVERYTEISTARKASSYFAPINNRNAVYDIDADALPPSWARMVAALILSARCCLDIPPNNDNR